ncbi:hypothetical protein J5N58_25750 [Rhizobium cremeum]|uniref:hypothetical protein n=1 Tax=Rhizobium cremeum TaxID=2813827 RepID=UPI001FD1BB49|nr:hypothetical protein [Rhizobium cremeum]MCJ7993435.1 hypothetical protein [Rhizobium cremeum]MCJ8003091.1 hypothetical protein [Rhizobium cremeum]
MSKSNFEEQIVQGAYVLGRQRDQFASEKRNLARQLRYAQHSARLGNLSKQYDFGMVFFSTLGAVSLILFDAKSDPNGWVITVFGFLMMLLAFGIAFQSRKMVNRAKSFHDRFGSWQI